MFDVLFFFYFWCRHHILNIYMSIEFHIQWVKIFHFIFIAKTFKQESTKIYQRLLRLVLFFGMKRKCTTIFLFIIATLLLVKNCDRFRWLKNKLFNSKICCRWNWMNFVFTRPNENFIVMSFRNSINQITKKTNVHVKLSRKLSSQHFTIYIIVYRLYALYCV